MRDPSHPGCCVPWSVRLRAVKGLSCLHPDTLSYAKAAGKWGIWRTAQVPWPSPFPPVPLPLLGVTCALPAPPSQSWQVSATTSVHGHLHTFCPEGNTCTLVPPASWCPGRTWSTSRASEPHLTLAPGRLQWGCPARCNPNQLAWPCCCVEMKSSHKTLVMTKVCSAFLWWEELVNWI